MINQESVCTQLLEVPDLTMVTIVVKINNKFVFSLHIYRHPCSTEGNGVLSLPVSQFDHQNK